MVSQSTLVAAIAWGILFLVPLVMLFIVPRRRSPTSAIAWLLLIALLPILGLLFFLILGSPKLPGSHRCDRAGTGRRCACDGRQ
jgi:cardiolipin synthase A/B